MAPELAFAPCRAAPVCRRLGPEGRYPKDNLAGRIPVPRMTPALRAAVRCITMKSDFFARRALLILCVLFFLIPFAMRGARMSWERMENNVRDWLPGRFEETQELAWFGQHFRRRAVVGGAHLGGLFGAG